jgi:hypothetical protein
MIGWLTMMIYSYLSRAFLSLFRSCVCHVNAYTRIPVQRLESERVTEVLIVPQQYLVPKFDFLRFTCSESM